VQCGNEKLKMEKGRVIQYVAHYCGTSPTESITTTGKKRDPCFTFKNAFLSLSQISDTIIN